MHAAIVDIAYSGQWQIAALVLEDGIVHSETGQNCPNDHSEGALEQHHLPHRR